MLHELTHTKIKNHSSIFWEELEKICPNSKLKRKELRNNYGSVSSIPLGRSGKLSEVSDLVVYLASERASYLHGTTVNISGGKSRG